MRSWPWALLAATLLLAGCRDGTPERHPTSVLGGGGAAAPRAPALLALTDGSGQAIPPPPVPSHAQPQMARIGGDGALAIWVQEAHVLASSWTRAGGWTPPQALESIYGEAGAPQLASNGQGVAMAVWQHRVGNILSLRFSRFETAGGWTAPDVLPGALPRPASAGSPPGSGTLQLQVDAQGNAVAEWPSGFRADEMQTARYTAGEGWTRAAGEPVASAPAASSALPVPSSAR